VPPSAGLDLAPRLASAPVKAPLTWPKSSLSRSSRERLGQLTVTKFEFDDPAFQFARPFHALEHLA
jgi:hypothetical protein